MRMKMSLTTCWYVYSHVCDITYYCYCFCWFIPIAPHLRFFLPTNAAQVSSIGLNTALHFIFSTFSHHFKLFVLFKPACDCTHATPAYAHRHFQITIPELVTAFPLLKYLPVYFNVKKEGFTVQYLQCFADPALVQDRSLYINLLCSYNN